MNELGKVGYIQDLFLDIRINSGKNIIETSFYTRHCFMKEWGKVVGATFKTGFRCNRINVIETSLYTRDAVLRFDLRLMGTGRRKPEWKLEDVGEREKTTTVETGTLKIDEQSNPSRDGKQENCAFLETH